MSDDTRAEIEAALDELTDAIIECQPQLPAWDDGSQFTDPLDDDAAGVRTTDAEGLMRRAEIDAKLALIAALMEDDAAEVAPRKAIDAE